MKVDYGMHKNTWYWDPSFQKATENPLFIYDKARHKCPIAHSQHFNWSVFQHCDLLAIVNDHHQFSNKVSSHTSVPNGMDPPEHTVYRQMIERYFSPAILNHFEPRCRQLANTLVGNLPKNKPIAIMEDFAQKFALQVQCEFLGWPEKMQGALAQWMNNNYQASLAKKPNETAAVAKEFSEFIHILLEIRRAAGADAPRDIITELLNTTVAGQPLSEDIIVSVLRNWTAGEVGTIAAAVGILVHFLAEQTQLQETLRQQPEKLPEAINEILRIHGPLISNRRVTRCPAVINGQQLGEGELLTLFWVSANRDEKIFAEPTRFRWGRDHSKNLLYGAGIHVCPGAKLAQMELRFIITALLTNTTSIQLTPNYPNAYARYPASGFSSLSVILN